MKVVWRSSGGFLLACILVIATAGSGHAKRVSEARRKANVAPNLNLQQVHTLGGRPAPFILNAPSAELIDARSGAVLYAYNEHTRIQPASLAKIMTFYLTLEALNKRKLSPASKATVSKEAWRLSMDRSVSRMFLEPGQEVPIETLLYGLMVSSGNDAAVVLADYLGGSDEAFVRMMNEDAKALGLSETRFASPDGLPEPDQYTTAYDMVKLGRALLNRFPDATKYTSTKEFTFHNIRQRNFNTLLFYDSRVIGIKTGHIQEAGFHLVAAARTDKMMVISAVMGAPSAEKRRVETKKLYDWAFRTFTEIGPDWHKAVAPTVRVYQGDVNYAAIEPAREPIATVYQGEESKVSLQATLKSGYLVAPVDKGTNVGELTLLFDGKPQETIAVQTAAAVGAGGLLHRFVDRVLMLFAKRYGGQK